MSLHRAVRSDWSGIPPEKRNRWQRLAAASSGVLTPGNAVSLIGAVLVLIGLYAFSNEQLITGLFYIFVGRLADVVDGFIAERSKTKSPLGEALDASLDKILILLALLVLVHKDVLPLVIGLIMLFQALYNSAVFLVAKRLRIRLHPSPAGKVGTSVEWFCVGMYVLAAILKARASGHDNTWALWVAGLSFIVFLILSLWSGFNYSRTIYYKRAMRS